MNNFFISKLRNRLNFKRKKYVKKGKVYPGENIFDYLMDFFPLDNNSLPSPIFFIGSARAGTTLAFSFMEHHPDVACMYEPNIKWMNFFKERRDKNEHGDLLYISDADERVKKYLFNEFNKYRKRENKPFFAEKDPRNSLRVDFINTVFPNSRFVVIQRYPYSNICSLMKRHMEARAILKNKKKESQWWRSGDGWAEQRIPGWRELRNFSLLEASAWQYRHTILKMEKDLKKINPERIFRYKFEDLIKKPKEFQDRLYDFFDLSFCEEARKVLETVKKPRSNIEEMMSIDEIKKINQICYEVFNKIDYKMINA